MPQKKLPPGACRHCGRVGRKLRPRGLCWACASDVDVRHRYPDYLGRTGAPPHSEDFYGPAPPPEEFTDHPPGSEGKIEVLTDRFSRMVSLWHPKDMTMERLNAGR